MSSTLSDRSDPSTTLLRPNSYTHPAGTRLSDADVDAGPDAAAAAAASTAEAGGAAAADPLSDRAAIHYNTTLALASSNASSGIRGAYFLNQLLAVCGGANAADAVEILAVSFILPAAQSDLHLSGAEKGWLAGVIFAGMMIGGWVWGGLSDRYGRRNCLMWCLLINGLGGMLSALSPTFILMLLCRFVSGIGVGGSVPVVFTYFSEFLSTRDRGPYMVGIACCWMVGSLFTAGLAWAIIPRTWMEMRVAGLVWHSWRLFAFLCGLPSLVCAAALSFCPESPRWLLSRGRHLEAKQILVAMYEVNHRDAMLRTEIDAAAGDGHQAADRAGAGAAGAAGEEQRVHAELRVEELSSGAWSNRWCGVCCFRRRARNRTAHARPFVVPLSLAEMEAERQHIGLSDGEATSAGVASTAAAVPSPRSADSNEDANLLGPGASQSGTHSSSSGGHGAKYSSLAAAAPHSLDDPAEAGSGSASTLAVTTAPVPASTTHFPSPRAVPVSSAFSEDFYSNCSERERWSLFLVQLARLDAVPVAPMSPPVAQQQDAQVHRVDSESYTYADAERDAEERGLSTVALASSSSSSGHQWSPAPSPSDALVLPSDGGGGDDALLVDEDGADGVSARFRRRCCRSCACSCASASALFHSCWLECRSVLAKTGSLFRGPSRLLTLQLGSTWFCLAFGVYGLTMWMPQYFADQDAAAAAEAGGSGSGSGTAEEEDVTSNSMYITAVVGAVSALPANLASLYTVRAYGRVRTLVLALLLSSLCVALVPVINTRAGSVAMLTIFSGVNTACWNALNVSTTEVYRTEVRATAFGFCAALGRVGAILGNVMFGELMDSTSQVMPLFITAAALLLAAIAGAMLPETKNLNLT